MFEAPLNQHLYALTCAMRFPPSRIKDIYMYIYSDWAVYFSSDSYQHVYVFMPSISLHIHRLPAWLVYRPLCDCCNFIYASSVYTYTGSLSIWLLARYMYSYIRWCQPFTNSHLSYIWMDWPTVYMRRPDSVPSNIIIPDNLHYSSNAILFDLN